MSGCPSCSRRRTELTNAEHDLRIAARRAARAETQRSLRIVAIARTERDKQRAALEEHLASCTVTSGGAR